MRFASRHAATAVGMAMLVAAPIGSASAEAGSSPDGFSQVRGTMQADLITGSPKREFIQGAGGSDQLQGRGGMDFVYGGPGWDLVAGGLHSDWADGGPGNDVSTGGDGADVVIAMHGDDVLNGGSGRDWIAVGLGSDVARGGDGGDYVVLLNDGRPDSVKCGDGRDVVDFARGRDPLDTFRACERMGGSELDVPAPPILEFYEQTNPESASATSQRAGSVLRQLLLRS